MTPVEVMVFKLCRDKGVRKEIFDEIDNEAKAAHGQAAVNKHREFDICLKALKRRGIISY